jgi:hypothetical protein
MAKPTFQLRLQERSEKVDLREWTLSAVEDLNEEQAQTILLAASEAIEYALAEPITAWFPAAWDSGDRSEDKTSIGFPMPIDPLIVCADLLLSDGMNATCLQFSLTDAVENAIDGYSCGDGLYRPEPGFTRIRDALRDLVKRMDEVIENAPKGEAA